MSHSVDWYKFTNYSEECTAAILRVKVKFWATFFILKSKIHCLVNLRFYTFFAINMLACVFISCGPAALRGPGPPHS